MTSLLSNCLTSSWMGFWRRVGPGEAKLKRAGLSTSPLCRQLERSSTRCRPDLGDFLFFCSAQAGFRAHRHLFKACIVSNQACCFNPYELSCPPYELLLFQIVQLTTFVIRGPATHSEEVIITHHQRRGNPWCPALCAGFCSETTRYTENLLLAVWLDNVV